MRSFMAKKIKTAVDRIEGEYLVCCDDETMNIRHLLRAEHPTLLPNDVLLITEENGRLLSVEHLKEETDARLRKAEERMHRLFKRKNS